MNCCCKCIATTFVMNRNQRITNQLLREQQDAAYQESLRADQEKVKKLSLYTIS